MGWNTADIAVRVAAEASSNAVGTFCGKPWFIPNTVFSELAPCDACGAGEILINDGEATAFTQTKLGMQLSLKPQKPEGALAPAQFYSIRLGGSSGANDYRSNIATCSSEVLVCQRSYGTEPGNMVGPTKLGVSDLIGDPSDLYLGLGQYQRVDGIVADTSRSLIVAPVWDVCTMAGFCPDNQLPDGGANVEIPVVGFVLFFLEGIQGNDVVGRLIAVFACGSEPIGEGEVETGPYSVPVRLVRLPE